MSINPPKKKPFTVRLTMWSAKHKWWVVVAWFGFVALLFGAGLLTGTRTNDVTRAGGAGKYEAAVANDVYNAGGGSTSIPTDQVVLVVSHPTLKLGDPAFNEIVKSVASKLRDVTFTEKGKTEPEKIFTQVLDPVTVPLAASQLTAQDKSTVRVVATFAGEQQLRKQKLNAVLPEIKALETELKKTQPDLKALVYNGTLLNDDFNRLLGEELDGTLRLTLPLTFIILLVAFGAVAAAVIPLILAGSALVGAFGLLALYSYFISPADSSASQVVVCIGLAVGIDYSLFFITRFRSERRRGREKFSALEVAANTAGRAVFFSGVTVMISLGGLYLVDDPVFASIATGTIGVVFMSVIASLTFLPAVLSILGDNISWGRIPYFGREKEEGSGFWANLVRTVMSHPIVAASIVTVILLVVSIPVLHFRLGNNGIDGLPDSLEGAQAIRLLNEKFPAGTTLRLQVVVTNPNRADVKAAAEKFQPQLLAIPGLSGPVETSLNRAGTAARYDVLMSGNRNDPANGEIVRKVRNELIPASFGNLPDVKAYVTGSAAYTLDQTKFYADAIVPVFSFVLGLSFLLLLITFRSLIIPIKAILLNLLSTGAAYGAMVMVFQEGWFSQQIGFRPTGVIENFTPLFIFTILFGLSMDYHLFILTRIKEAKDHGVSSNEAVAIGISTTSGTITSAAAIMVVVFSVFVSLQIMIVRQLGLGLAVAVLVDATIIRCILLPATMKLLGEWNWWLPGFLQWLPRLTIEVEPENEVQVPSPEIKDRLMKEPEAEPEPASRAQN